MPLTIGVPREVFPDEKRVATIPDVVEKLIKLGFAVAIESGAGDAANFSDDTYRAAGATVVGYSSADVGPHSHESLRAAGATVVLGDMGQLPTLI